MARILIVEDDTDLRDMLKESLTQSGYHTGAACHLGYLSGARHSHLDSGGYSLDQKAIAKGEALTPQAIATALLEEETWRQVLSSLVICFFARGVYTPQAIQDALAAIGLAYTPDDLHRIGAEVLKLKHQFKLREGFNLRTIRIPKRILETPSSAGMIDEKLMRDTLALIAKKMEE